MSPKTWLLSYRSRRRGNWLEIHSWRCFQIPATEILVQCLCGHRHPDSGHGHCHIHAVPGRRLLPLQQGRLALSLCGKPCTHTSPLCQCCLEFWELWQCFVALLGQCVSSNPTLTSIPFQSHKLMASSRMKCLACMLLDIACWCQAPCTQSMCGVWAIEL